MYSDDSFFTMLGMFMTCAVQCVFYLAGCIAFIFLARSAHRRFREDLSQDNMKRFMAFRIGAYVCGGLFLLMLLIGFIALRMSRDLM